MNNQTMTEADLRRENAELRASYARMRGALSSLRANVYAGIAVSDRHALIDAMCLTNLRCIERDLAEVEKVLAELPAASLATITAPLEARIARLTAWIMDRDHDKWCQNWQDGGACTCGMDEVLDTKAIQSLAAIQAAARAEEREACAQLAHGIAKTWPWLAERLGKEIRNRATEARGE